MIIVRPKKKLGQHFLTDRNIARKIVDSLGTSVPDVLEVGAGKGILTGFLLQRSELNLHIVEIDPDSVKFLRENFSLTSERLHLANFLKWYPDCFSGSFNIIGNFPYNISSQIFLRILKMHERIPEVVGMVQKEVAERISSPPGIKAYGILSVLIGAFYDIDYLFTVSPKVFVPTPKVKSAVIRLRHKNTGNLPCREDLFFQTVKKAFNQRRKMLRNSLNEQGIKIPEDYAEKRPEQLSVVDFIRLTRILENQKDFHHGS
jgi:16S rRNA (adenine1518-N6/adenine1519-N6)-dimethyltransferase